MSNEKKLPDWTHVPEWANYRTIDANGDLFYHKEKPYIFTDQWLSDGEYLFCGKVTPFDGWDKFIEQRPEPQTQDKEPVTWEWLQSVGFKEDPFGYYFNGVNNIGVYLSNGINEGLFRIDFIKGLNNMTITQPSGEELTREKVLQIISVFS